MKKDEELLLLAYVDGELEADKFKLWLKGLEHGNSLSHLTAKVLPANWIEFFLEKIHIDAEKWLMMQYSKENNVVALRSSESLGSTTSSKELQQSFIESKSPYSQGKNNLLSNEEPFPPLSKRLDLANKTSRRVTPILVAADSHKISTLFANNQEAHGLMNNSLMGSDNEFYIYRKSKEGQGSILSKDKLRYPFQIQASSESCNSVPIQSISLQSKKEEIHAPSQRKIRERITEVDLAQVMSTLDKQSRDTSDRIAMLFMYILANNLCVQVADEITFIFKLLTIKFAENTAIPKASTKTETSMLKDAGSLRLIPNLFPSYAACLLFALDALKHCSFLECFLDMKLSLALKENERIISFMPMMVDRLSKVCDQLSISQDAEKFLLYDSPSNSHMSVPHRGQADFKSNMPKRQDIFHNRQKARDVFFGLVRMGLARFELGNNFIKQFETKVHEFLVDLREENLYWFAGLFCDELLAICVYYDVRDVDPSMAQLGGREKLKKLHDRLITGPAMKMSGDRIINDFNSFEDIFVQILKFADSYRLNLFIVQALLLRINQFFEKLEVERILLSGFFAETVLKLKILVKFLGFIRFHPLWIEETVLSQDRIEQPTSLSALLVANDFNVIEHIVSALRQKSVISCFPWLIEYMRMFPKLNNVLADHNVINMMEVLSFIRWQYAPSIPNLRARFLIISMLDDLISRQIFQLPYFAEQDLNYAKLLIQTTITPNSAAPSCKYIYGLDERLHLVSDTLLRASLNLLRELDFFIIDFNAKQRNNFHGEIPRTAMKKITPLRENATPVDYLQSPSNQRQLQNWFFWQHPALKELVEFSTNNICKSEIELFFDTYEWIDLKIATLKIQSKLDSATDEKTLQQYAHEFDISDWLMKLQEELIKDSRNHCNTVCLGKISATIESLCPKTIDDQAAKLSVSIAQEKARLLIDDLIKKKSHVVLMRFESLLNKLIKDMVRERMQSIKSGVLLSSFNLLIDKDPNESIFLSLLDFLNRAMTNLPLNEQPDIVFEQVWKGFWRFLQVPTLETETLLDNIDIEVENAIILLLTIKSIFCFTYNKFRALILEEMRKFLENDELSLIKHEQFLSKFKRRAYEKHLLNDRSFSSLCVSLKNTSLSEMTLVSH